MDPDTALEAAQGAPEHDPHQTMTQAEIVQPDASHEAQEACGDQEPHETRQTPRDEALTELVGAALRRRVAQKDLGELLASCRTCHSHRAAGNPRGCDQHGAQYADDLSAMQAAERDLERACDAVMA